MPSNTDIDAAESEGPGLERAITLTDAVVAIAMTLLVLPLVEVSGEVDTRHLGHFLSENSDLLTSFVISFLVIYVFWGAHGSTFYRAETHRVERASLRQLSMWWLLVIAFLPFPTAVAGGELTTTSAPLYIGTMLVLSALTSAMATVVDSAIGTARRRAAWAWLTTAVFALCTALSAVSPNLGVYALLLLVVVRVVEVRAMRNPSPGAAS